MAEQRLYPIIISALTIAEVHKKRGKDRLEGDENQNVLEYMEHDFVNPVTVDRVIGEEANRLFRKHEDLKLSPNDAIHLACAKKAGCDVLLSWDEVLNAIEDPDIRTERPQIHLPLPRMPDPQASLFDADSDSVDQSEKPKAGIDSDDIRRGGIESTDGKAQREAGQNEPETTSETGVHARGAGVTDEPEQKESEPHADAKPAGDVNGGSEKLVAVARPGIEPTTQGFTGNHPSDPDLRSTPEGSQNGLESNEG